MGHGPADDRLDVGGVERLRDRAGEHVVEARVPRSPRVAVPDASRTVERTAERGVELVERARARAPRRLRARARALQRPLPGAHRGRRSRADRTAPRPEPRTSPRRGLPLDRAIAPHRERREHGQQADRPDEREQQRVLGPATSPTGTGSGCRRGRASRETSALTGFHSAIGCRIPGSVSVGTNAFETNVSGKITRKPSCCATSTVFTSRPSSTPIHDIVNVKRSISTTASTNSPHRAVHPPADGEAREHQDDEDPGVVDDVGGRPPAEHRGAGHRQRAEAVDQALAHVVRHPDRRS